MGIHDRDYYRGQRGKPYRIGAQSVVVNLIIINVAVWLAQLISGGDGAVTRFVACRPEDIFAGFPELWKLVTANFAHSWRDPWHIFINMLFLYFFGRDLELMYGKRDFLTLYLMGGVLGVFAEATSLQMASASNPDLARSPILGASAAVAAILVVFTLYYPKRTILFFFFIPAPVWILCVLFLVQDLLGVTYQVHDGVAHFAHLAGAGFGFLFKHFDLRWSNVQRWTGRGTPRSRRRRQHREQPGPLDPRVFRPRVEPQSDAISKRVDELLAKISDQGMGSLTEEEHKFLVENSRRYKST